MAENENVIYVGSKPTMNYVLAVITQFHSGAKQVIVKARGRAISKAVDVVEIVRNKFMNDVKPVKIEVMTEEIETEKGTRNISTMTITLEKSA